MSSRLEEENRNGRFTMKSKENEKQAGFTLIEMLIVVAIIGILATIATVGYQRYTARARGVEIIEKYDAIRASVAIEGTQNSNPDDCAELAKGLNSSNLADPYATLSYGFQAVSGGWPVLVVCAQAGSQGVLGVQTARGVYDTMRSDSVIESGAVLTETLVSFAMRLTSDDAPLCKKSVSPTTVACNGAAVSKPVTAVATATTTAACPAGQTRSTGGQCIPSSGTPAVIPPVVAVVPKLAPMAESVKTDFSQPPITGTWMSQDPGVWGWKTDNPDGKVEYGKGEAYGDTSGGNIGVIELEGYAGAPSNLYREISAQPGAKYEFSFDLSGRVGTTSESAAVQVIWEGKVVDTIYPPGNAFGFSRHAYNLVATGSSSRIELRAVTQDGSGPVVDNLGMAFKGVAVPPSPSP